MGPTEHHLLEDPLSHLPCSHIIEYRKGHTVYGPDLPSKSIYLIIDGKVKVCRNAEDGRQVVIDIYQPDEFFGESAFLGNQTNETAVAIENVKVMAWTTAELEDLLTKRPRLSIALLQLLVHRQQDFGARIESFSLDNISKRLARSLIRFSERLGQEQADGGVQMIPFTHELLSQYVGTSREIVTHYMNTFRRQGFLTYSRKGIMLHRDLLKEWVRSGESAEQAAA
jgi:CRP/FNR family transcriptional regulator